MATIDWVIVDSRRCELLGRQVALLEERLFPADAPELMGYQVKATRCSDHVVCNMAGFPCRHAFTNPDSDRLALAR
jgi:hypothetical protein